jgi:hypothetical protein
MGKNIKQYDNVTTPALTDILYEVQSDIDKNITLQQIKDLFGISDIEDWAIKTQAAGTGYIDLIDSTIYGAVRIEYFARRGSRTYRTGGVTLMVDAGATDGVTVADRWDANGSDNDDLGLNIDDGFLSSGVVQLKMVVDSSDGDPIIFNYKILSKRPITIS